MAIPLIIKRIAIFLGYDVGVQEGNIRKTMAARGLVNGRGPRSGRDLVFRCYPPEPLFSPSLPKKKKPTLLGRPLSVVPPRIELGTQGFSVLCSTN